MNCVLMCRNRNLCCLPCLSFSLNGLEIEHVYNFNFLGLIINCHLDWKPHLNNINILQHSIPKFQSKVQPTAS